MKPELVAPTAALAAALLAKVEADKVGTEAVAKAFEQAYEGLMVGIQRVDASRRLRNQRE